LAADDETLDLIGALEDLHDLRFAHVALDGVVVGVSATAQDLDGVRGDLHRGVGGDQFGDAGLPAVGETRVAATGGVEIGGPCRVDRLRESGVITDFTVQVDHSKLGWSIEAFVELTYTGTTPVGEIVRTAYRTAEAQAVFTIADALDSLVHVRVRDIGHLQHVIDGLRRTGNVTSTKTLMILGSWTRN
jgi:Lrp/AsnC family transcriptional regulator, leucine-responsive regulatory protein